MKTKKQKKLNYNPGGLETFRVKRLRYFILIILIVIGGVLSGMLFSKGPGGNKLELDGLKNTYLDVDKNKKVTSLSPEENLYTALKVFKDKEYFQVEITSLTKPKTSIGIGVSAQESIELKNYAKGYLVSTALTKGVVSVGHERFTSDEYFFHRKPKKVNTDIKKIIWQDPMAMDKKAFIEAFGSDLRDFIPYVSNKKTLKKAEYVGKENNLYRFHYVFDLEVGPARYARQVNTFSGSTSFPLFLTLECDIFINDKWEVFKTVNKEKYEVSINAVGKVVCDSVVTQKMTYEKRELDCLSYYKKFFGKKPDDNKSLKEPFEILQDAMGAFLTDDRGINAKGSALLFGEALDFDFSINPKTKAISFNLGNKVFGKTKENTLFVKFNDFLGTYNFTKTEDETPILERPMVKEILEGLEAKLIDGKYILTTVYRGFNLKFVVDEPTGNLDYIDFNFRFAEEEPLLSGRVKLAKGFKEFNFDDNSLEKTDLNHLRDLLKKIFVTKKLRLNFSYTKSFNSVNVVLTGDVFVSFDKEIKVDGKIFLYFNNEKYEVKIKALNDFIYLDLFNKKLKLSTIDFKNLFAKFTEDFEEKGISKIFDLISDLSIKLGSDKILASVKNLNAKLSILASDFPVEVSESTYEDFAIYKETIFKFIELIKTSDLTFKINGYKLINNLDLLLTGEGYFNRLTGEIFFEGSIYLNTNIIPIKFKVNNGEIYFSFLEKTYVVSLEELKDAFLSVTDITKELNKDAFNIIQLIFKDLFTNFTFTNAGFKSEVSLFNENYTVNFNELGLNVEGKHLNLNISKTISLSSLPVFEKPYRITKVKNIFKILNDSYKQKAAKVSGKINLEKVNLDFELTLNLESKSVVGEIKVKFLEKEKTFLINFKNNTFFIKINDSEKIYSIDLATIKALFSETKINSENILSLLLSFDLEHVLVTDDFVSFSTEIFDLKFSSTKEKPLTLLENAEAIDEYLLALKELFTNAKESGLNGLLNLKAKDANVSGNVNLNLKDSSFSFSGLINAFNKEFDLKLAFKNKLLKLKLDAFSMLLTDTEALELIKKHASILSLDTSSFYALLLDVKLSKENNLYEIKTNSFTLKYSQNTLYFKSDNFEIDLLVKKEEQISFEVENPITFENVDKILTDGKDFFKKAFESKTLKVHAEIKKKINDNDLTISLDGVISFADSLKLEALTSIKLLDDVKRVKVKIIDKHVFLEFFDKEKYKLTLSEVEELIALFKPIFKPFNLSDLMLSFLDNTLSLKTDDLLIDFEAIENYNFTPINESDYQNFSSVKEHIKDIVSFVNADGFCIDVFYQKNEMTLSGKIVIAKTLDLFSIEGKIVTNGKTVPIKAVLSKNACYLDLLNTKTKISYSSFSELTEVIPKSDFIIKAVSEFIDNLDLNHFRSFVTINKKKIEIKKQQKTFIFESSNFKLTLSEKTDEIIEPNDLDYENKIAFSSISNFIKLLKNKKSLKINGKVSVEKVDFIFSGNLNLFKKEGKVLVSTYLNNELITFEIIFKDNTFYIDVLNKHKLKIDKENLFIFLKQNFSFDFEGTEVLVKEIENGFNLQFSLGFVSVILGEEELVSLTGDYLAFNNSLEIISSYLDNEKLIFASEINNTFKLGNQDAKLEGKALINLKSFDFSFEGVLVLSENKLNLRIAYLQGVLYIDSSIIKTTLTLDQVNKLLSAFNLQKFSLLNALESMVISYNADVLHINYKDFKLSIGKEAFSLAFKENTLRFLKTNKEIVKPEYIDTVSGENVVSNLKTKVAFLKTLFDKKSIKVNFLTAIKGESLEVDGILSFKDGIYVQLSLKYKTYSYNLLAVYKENRLLLNVLNKTIEFSDEDLQKVKTKLINFFNKEDLLNQNLFDYLEFDENLNVVINKALLGLEENIVLIINKDNLKVLGLKDAALNIELNDAASFTLTRDYEFKAFEGLFDNALKLLKEKSFNIKTKFIVDDFGFPAFLDIDAHIDFHNEPKVYGDGKITFTHDLVVGSQNYSFLLDKTEIRLVLNDIVKGRIPFDELKHVISLSVDPNSFNLDLGLDNGKIVLTLNDDFKNLEIFSENNALKLRSKVLTVDVIEEDVIYNQKLDEDLDIIKSNVIEKIYRFTKHDVFTYGLNYKDENGSFNLNGSFSVFDKKFKLFGSGKALVKAFEFNIKLGIEEKDFLMVADRFEMKLTHEEAVNLFGEVATDVAYFIDIPSQLNVPEFVQKISSLTLLAEGIEFVIDGYNVSYLNNEVTVEGHSFKIKLTPDGVIPESLELSTPLLKSDLDQIIKAIKQILKLKDAGNNKYRTAIEIFENNSLRYTANAEMNFNVTNEDVKIHAKLYLKDLLKPNEDRNVELIFIDGVFYFNYNGLGFKLGMVEGKKVLRYILDYMQIKNKIIDKLLDVDLEGNIFEHLQPKPEESITQFKNILENLKILKVNGNKIELGFYKEVYNFPAEHDLNIKITTGDVAISDVTLTDIYVKENTRVNLFCEHFGDSEDVAVPSWEKIIDLNGCDDFVFAALNSASYGKYHLTGNILFSIIGIKFGIKDVDAKITLDEAKQPTIHLTGHLDYVPFAITKTFDLELYYYQKVIYVKHTYMYWFTQKTDYFKITEDEFKENPAQSLQKILCLHNNVVKQIELNSGNNAQPIKFEKVLLDYQIKDNGRIHYLYLSGKELTRNNSFGNVDVDFYVENRELTGLDISTTISGILGLNIRANNLKVPDNFEIEIPNFSQNW